MKEIEFILNFLAFATMFFIGIAIYLFISVTQILKNQSFIVDKINDLKKEVKEIIDIANKPY